MEDREHLIKGLNELAQIAPTRYYADIAKQAAREIYDLNTQLDFARKQNQILGSAVNEGVK